MKLENKNNKILDDLITRNENWDKLDGLVEKVEDNTTRIDILDGYILKDIENFKDVQRIVRMGIADKVFTVGDQFIAEYDGTPHKWDIIGIDHDKPTDPNFTHSMTIQAHDCIMNCQFSETQALYHADEPLPPGEHVFTRDSIGGGGRWSITTTEIVPEGGLIDIYSWQTSGDYAPLRARIYAADRESVIEDDIEVTQTTKEDTLGEVNVRHRMMYGSNNYMESAIRQFLNSDESEFTWNPKTKFDRPSTGAPYSGAGFLNQLDPELKSVIGEVDKQVARNTVTDGGGQDIFSDKVFLLSRVEIYGGNEGIVEGEEPYEYYSNMASAPVAGDVDWRIKYLSGSPRFWWLRAPLPGNSHYPRLVVTSGYVSDYGAVYAYGLAPACVII